MNINENLLALAEKAERELVESGVFARIEKTAFDNQMRVMDAFREHQVSESHFCPTTGYGYDDRGRDVLEEMFADVFETEDAIVRHNIISGTQALCIGLFGILRTGDRMLSVTGKPYDTLDEVIGLRGEGMGSLRDFGVKYDEIAMTPDGGIDIPAMEEALRSADDIKMVYIQRSKGYAVRRTLSAKEIGDAAKAAHAIKKDVFVFVDNCYGEFCDEHEPTYYGADLCVGSLIKNAGGGMAETGGYIAGTKKAVELCSYRLTTPGIGKEAGASLGQTKFMYKGLFYAPHTVAQALKTGVFAAKLFEYLGYDIYPKAEEERHDIIQTVTLGTADGLLKFCQGIQSGSPVDSHVLPEAWDMPGYADAVVMAAGAFTSGASIELSADGPMKAPFTAYLQGGLTYESGKIGILLAAQKIIGEN
ncbi:MAG: hypothetical protein E7656_06405 [Ruminococcaceae bacterium]|nr:hypothetical protein [Oscillospiraceae bacterium]